MVAATTRIYTVLKKTIPDPFSFLFTQQGRRIYTVYFCIIGWLLSSFNNIISYKARRIRFLNCKGNRNEVPRIRPKFENKYF